jgi:hypothetical protein
MSEGDGEAGEVQAEGEGGDGAQAPPEAVQAESGPAAERPGHYEQVTEYELGILRSHRVRVED